MRIPFTEISFFLRPRARLSSRFRARRTRQKRPTVVRFFKPSTPGRRDGPWRRAWRVRPPPGPGSPRARAWGASGPRARAADPCASSRATFPSTTGRSRHRRRRRSTRSPRAFASAWAAARRTRARSRARSARTGSKPLRTSRRSLWTSSSRWACPRGGARRCASFLARRRTPRAWRPARPPRPARRPNGQMLARTGGSADRCPAPTKDWRGPPPDARRSSPGTGEATTSSPRDKKKRITGRARRERSRRRAPPSRCRAFASRNANVCPRTRCATRRFPRRCGWSWKKCGGTSRRAAWAAVARPCARRRRRITKRWLAV